MKPAINFFSHHDDKVLDLYSGGRSLDAIYTNKNLNRNERLLLNCLARHQNFKSNFQESRYMTNAFMCSEMCISRRTLNKVANQLVEKGYINKLPDFDARGGQRANVYRILPKLFDEFRSEKLMCKPCQGAEKKLPGGGGKTCHQNSLIRRSLNKKDPSISNLPFLKLATSEAVPSGTGKLETEKIPTEQHGDRSVRNLPKTNSEAQKQKCPTENYKPVILATDNVRLPENDLSSIQRLEKEQNTVTGTPAEPGAGNRASGKPAVRGIVAKVPGKEKAKAETAKRLEEAKRKFAEMRARVNGVSESPQVEVLRQEQCEAKPEVESKPVAPEMPAVPLRNPKPEARRQQWDDVQRNPKQTYRMMLSKPLQESRQKVVCGQVAGTVAHVIQPMPRGTVVKTRQLISALFADSNYNQPAIAYITDVILKKYSLSILFELEKDMIDSGFIGKQNFNSGYLLRMCEHIANRRCSA